MACLPVLSDPLSTLAFVILCLVAAHPPRRIGTRPEPSWDACLQSRYPCADLHSSETWTKSWTISAEYAVYQLVCDARGVAAAPPESTGRARV